MLFETESTALAANASDIEDVHGHFVAWFMWGFIQTIIFVIFSGWSSMKGMSMNPTVLSGLSCIIVCAELAWYIAGMVWRFNEAGNFASGDSPYAGYSDSAWEKYAQCDSSFEYPDNYCGFQYASGKFMFVYYVITWCVLGLACVCGCCGCCCAAIGVGVGAAVEQERRSN